MGNPSKHFTDFEDHHQIIKWRNLVRGLIQHFVELFGLSYVRMWIFESWNEPDHHVFERINMTSRGYLNYYDASSEGVRLAGEWFIFGGPAAACRLTRFSRLCWLLLDHVVNGRNYFTGETVRMDFISFHKKGGPDKHGSGSSDYILHTELETVKRIYELYPTLKNHSVFNDEGDPMVSWITPHQWRADTTYPAMVIKVISRHQNEVIRDHVFPLKLFSNDNAFLNYRPHYFTQRTLLARFQMNGTATWPQARSVEFIQKPIYSAMILLALMQGDHLQHFINRTDGVTDDGNFGVLAAQYAGKELTILLYNSNDTHRYGISRQVALHIELPASMRNATDLRLMQFRIDHHFGNPYNVWKHFRSPDTPDDFLLSLMRQHEGPVAIGKPSSYSCNSVHVLLPNPSVHVVHVCTKSRTLGQVTDLNVRRLTQGKILLTWKSRMESLKTRCVLTYEVLYSTSRNGRFRRINAKNSISTVHYHSVNTATWIRGIDRIRRICWRMISLHSGRHLRHHGPHGFNNLILHRQCRVYRHYTQLTVRGYYKVRFIDYWQRTGADSNIVFYENI
ncbi:alpha-L-iduronidase-like isoform X2 [Tubulanus polymorphus]